MTPAANPPVNLLAIDPGPEQSAWVLLRDDGKLLEFRKEPNAVVRNRVAGLGRDDWLVIEQIASMGMAVGAEVFETAVWTGRFWEATPAFVYRIKRAEIKMHLCGSMRAKDPNIRQALIDRWGGPSSIKKGGDLYRVSSDCWSALAVAVTWFDKYYQVRKEL